jgi:hypothetical protein
VFDIAFHGLDEVWYQVVTPGELDVDLGKCVFDAISRVDEIIIDRDSVGDDRDDYREENQK